ncbi:MAG: diacylglycerol kinase family protein [Acidobacteriota bacterium]
MPATVRGSLYINRRSGSGNDGTVDRVCAAAEGRGLSCVDITPDLDISRSIRERMDRGEKLFVAAGGDGTINYVIQSLVGTEAVLGVLPIGTFNHFAKDLKIPLDWSAALDVVVSGATTQVDCARINNRYFLNNISFGLYPEVVAEREKFRGKGKFTAYRYAIISALKKFKHVSLEVETAHRIQSIRTHVFMVSVNPYDVGRIGMMAPRETLEGGMLSVYWLPHIARIRLIRLVARYLSGKMELGEDFHSVRTPELRVRSSHKTLRFGMDGELVEMAPPFQIALVPKSVLVKVPQEEQATAV